MKVHYTLDGSSAHAIFVGWQIPTALKYGLTFFWLLVHLNLKNQGAIWVMLGLAENQEDRLSGGHFAEGAQSVPDQVCRWSCWSAPGEEGMPRQAGMPQHPVGMPGREQSWKLLHYNPARWYHRQHRITLRSRKPIQLTFALCAIEPGSAFAHTHPAGTSVNAQKGTDRHPRRGSLSRGFKRSWSWHRHPRSCFIPTVNGFCCVPNWPVL